MRIKHIIFMFSFIAVLPYTAHADVTADLRVKLGSSSGLNHIEFANGLSGEADKESSGNFQLDMAITQKNPDGVAFVGTFGTFFRAHDGHVSDPVAPTDIKYNAIGIDGSVGLSIRANENLNFEGRLELGIGIGKPTLTTPGYVWNDTENGAYASASLIFGAYYTFSKPGFQLGLELGAQSFEGKFKIKNSYGNSVDGTTKGNGGIANIVAGYRF
jgi:hypothetical protein